MNEKRRTASRKFIEELSKYKYYCKCGHSVVITKQNIEKILCSWCGNYIYKDKKREFEDKLKREMRVNR